MVENGSVVCNERGERYVVQAEKQAMERDLRTGNDDIHLAVVCITILRTMLGCALLGLDLVGEKCAL